MTYAYDTRLEKWVVIAGGDVVLHICDTEEEAKKFIEEAS